MSSTVRRQRNRFRREAAFTGKRLILDTIYFISVAKVASNLHVSLFIAIL